MVIYLIFVSDIGLTNLNKYSIVIEHLEQRGTYGPYYTLTYRSWLHGLGFYYLGRWSGRNDLSTVIEKLLETLESEGFIITVLDKNGDKGTRSHLRDGRKKSSRVQKGVMSENQLALIFTTFFVVVVTALIYFY